MSTRPKPSYAASCGPIEPFNGQTRRRQEISDLRKAFVGEPQQSRDTEVRRLFDACGGDFYLTVYAAVRQHIRERDRGVDVPLTAEADGHETPLRDPAIGAAA